jgi:predicted PurR-regulated permease PerM
MALNLTDRQAQTVATAITTLSALVILLAIGLLGWMIASFVRTFSAVFLPLAVGAIGALVFRPYYDWLHERLHLPPAAALGVLFLSVLIPLAGFLTFFGGIAIGQLTELLTHVPAWWEAGRIWASERLPEIAAVLESSGWAQRLREAAGNQQEAIVQGLQAVGGQFFAVGRGVARGIGNLFGWAIVPVYFAFFITNRGMTLDGGQFLPFLKKDTRDDVVYLAHQFVDILVAFFRGQLLVALLQGLLFAAGFSLIGLRYGFVIGLLLGFLNIVPYLGSMIGLAITIPLALLQPGGGVMICLLALLVFVIVQAIEGWVLTPKIMGDRTGLHFMTIIVAIFFWGTALDGIMGMILAIPLTAFLSSLWRLARDKYIPEVM